MMRRLGAAALLSASIASGAAMAEPTYTVVDWSELRGWADDDHREALEVFLETCPDMDPGVWGPICALAGQQRDDARSLFEALFRPVLVSDGNPGLFTGYFEPELEGSRSRTARFRYPIYRLPADVPQGGQWFTRAEIENGRLLEGRGLEIAWLADPVDAFFLHVQGSGRIRFTDGSGIRVGFGGRNGHPYRSVGAELARRGLFQPHQVSAAVIRRWVRDNPIDGAELLQHNPSYIFFREISGVADGKGPLGAMNRSITPLRTLAVDPDFVPLGAPVWLEKAGRAPMNRLMVAQDTGSAIKGAQRGDIFFGTGVAAGQKAGQIKDPGRMIVFLPIPLADALAPGG